MSHSREPHRRTSIDEPLRHRVSEVRPQDLAALVALCVEHAGYERAHPTPAPCAQRLHEALFMTPPRLHGWFARADGQVLGYATASCEFSTWAARDYLHMDCLYVRESARNRGVGADLLQAVVDRARRLGLAELQWQTPDWNVDAIRFYRRHGAVAKGKQRFVLALRREPVGLE